MKQFKYLILFLFPLACHALEPVYKGLFSDYAIKGYDTVAYFTENRAVKGDKRYSHEYQGAVWLFHSPEHLSLFVANPEKYAPEYGGYCAYAVSQNSTASIKPELFTIVNGKLYLNYNQSINQRWRENKNKLIEMADKHWPALLNE